MGPGGGCCICLPVEFPRGAQPVRVPAEHRVRQHGLKFGQDLVDWAGELEAARFSCGAQPQNRVGQGVDGFVGCMSAHHI